MLRTRASIAGLMWVVLVVALGLAALKSGTDQWSSAIFLLTCAAMALGIVGIVCDAPVARRWWVGFTVFGLGYLFLAFWFRFERFELPPIATDQLIAWLGGIFKSKLRGPVAFSEYALTVFWPFARIGHCLLALVIGTAVGILAQWIFPAPASAAERAAGPQTEPEPASPRRWIWAVGVWLAIAYAAAAVVGMRTPPSSGPA
jgi:hypothetical protein